MLFTYLFLLPHANYLIELYLLTSVTLQMALPMQYFTLHADRLRTSGFATIVFWQIGALEMIVYNLKPIADFKNLNFVIVYFFILAAARQLSH